MVRVVRYVIKLIKNKPIKQGISCFIPKNITRIESKSSLKKFKCPDFNIFLNDTTIKAKFMQVST